GPGAAAATAGSPRVRSETDRRPDGVSASHAAARGTRAGRGNDRLAVLLTVDVAGGRACPGPSPRGGAGPQGRFDRGGDDPGSSLAPPARPLRPGPSGAARHLPMNGEEPPPHEWGAQLPGFGFADGFRLAFA